MTITPVDNSNYILGGVICQALVTIGAAVVLTSVSVVPAAIFGVTKAIFDFLAAEASQRLLGPDAGLSGCVRLLKEITCFVLPVAGAVALTSLVGFPMTIGVGFLLVLAAAVAQLAMCCLCLTGGCCLVAATTRV